MCHGVFTRFPDLRVAIIENGGDWVVPLLEHLADTYRKMPQAFDEDPVEAFKRNVYISPFHEDDIAKLIDAIGADHVLFGSDYPHPEGLAEPCSYVDHLPPGHAAARTCEDIMGGNLGRLMRVPVASERTAPDRTAPRRARRAGPPAAGARRGHRSSTGCWCRRRLAHVVDHPEQLLDLQERTADVVAGGPDRMEGADQFHVPARGERVMEAPSPPAQSPTTSRVNPTAGCSPRQASTSLSSAALLTA